MRWSCSDFIVFGTESGKLHVWDGASFSSLAASKGHSGESSCMLQRPHIIVMTIHRCCNNCGFEYGW